MLEEAEGDLEQAIERFYLVTNDMSAVRSLRANALMHIGVCYEKLGKNKARNAFELLIAEYPDQQEMVAMAKEKLRSFGGETGEPRPKGVVIQHLRTESKGNRNWIYGISPDGKSYTYINWDVHEIMIHDLVNDKADSITYGNTWFAKPWSNPQDPVWSPDGSMIAYMWYAENVWEIRTIKRNGEDRKTVINGEEGAIPKVHAFTPDQEGLIGILDQEVDGQHIFKLALISMEKGDFRILKDFGTREVERLTFSPDGKYLLYSKDQENSANDDIYMLSYDDLKEVRLTTDPGNDRNPVWSRDGSDILFSARRFGTNNLYKINVKDGVKQEGEKLIKKNLGNRIKLMGVDVDDALYYVADNSRTDIFTMDLDKAFDDGQVIAKRITDLGMRTGGMAPRYSKDGRYISYISYLSNYHDEEPNADKNLVNKYYIGIYDTETGTHRELDIDLYGNHPWADIDEHIPDWSHDGKKLLLHGVRGENYEGGYYTVDVQTTEIEPLITYPDSKAWNWKRAGRMERFSTNSDAIYFTSVDWKNLMKYDLQDDSATTLLKTENGFWFRGLLDNDKHCLVGKDNKYYFYDLEEDKYTELFDKPVEEIGVFKGFSPDRHYCYTASKGEWAFVKEMRRVAVNRDEPDKTISLEEGFPNGMMWNGSMHPSKNEYVFDMQTNIGLDIYKLEGAFD